MAKSNSNLLNYLSLLLSNDEALQRFIADPISDAEQKYGLTKAERAVLRRTVSGLSNNSLNGYSIARELSSYRRSLRLLQNVLHNVGSKMAQEALANWPGGGPGPVFFPYTVIVNYPNVNANTDFTCKTNADVKGYGGPYANPTSPFTVNLTPTSTIGEVMAAVAKQYGLRYETVENPAGQSFVSAFEVGGFMISADLSNPCYALPTPGERFVNNNVFWFYSINGKPNTSQSVGHYTHQNFGNDGQSFWDYSVKSKDTIHWQLIAPDQAYGFLPCVAGQANEYAKAKN